MSSFLTNKVDKGVLFGLPLLGRIGTFRICAVESHMAAGVNTRALFRAFLDSTQVEIGTPIIQSLRPQPIFGGYKEEVDELTRLIGTLNDLTVTIYMLYVDFQYMCSLISFIFFVRGFVFSFL